MYRDVIVLDKHVRVVCDVLSWSCHVCCVSCLVVFITNIWCCLMVVLIVLCYL